jgi:predicted esterase
MRAGRLFLVALAILLSAPAMARSPILKLPTTTSASPLRTGTTIIDGVGLAYMPVAPATPAPLLLLFHGAGMPASDMIEGVRQEADQCGCALLAIQSEAPTWDLTLSLAEALRKARKDASGVEFGSDADRVERGLAEVMSRAEIDRFRIVPLGFSDGASYALSLALANPRLFRSAVAIAPGFVVPPSRQDLRQSLFIAHGRADKVLPFDDARQAVVVPLEQAGYDIRFRPFEGGHHIDRQSLRDGIRHALGD